MSNYYDDPIDEPDQPATRNKVWVVALGLCAVLLGSTFAANININTGSSVEFGQGVQVATACDSSVYISSAAVFANASSAGNTAFGIESVTVSDIAASCVGKSFKLNIYDSATSAALNSSPITISFAASPTNGQTFNGSTWSSGNADIAVLGATLTRATIDTTGTGLDSNTGRTTITVTGIKNSSGNRVQSISAERFTFETTKFITIYSIGDTGPGGGTIFLTPSTIGNPSGLYFEFAPVDVETSVPWGSLFVGVTNKNNPAGLAIGAGKANSAEILAKSTGPGGARSAAAYSNNGYSDWYLGSGNEINALCMYARGTITTRNPTTQNCNTGTLTGTWRNEYISSSVKGDDYMMRVVFTGYGLDFNLQPGAVRPLRSFAPGS